MAENVQKIILGKSERIKQAYRDSNYDLVDPVDPFVVIYSPSGEEVDSGTPTKQSTGIYYYVVSLSTASTTEEGIYQAYWQGTIGGEFVTQDTPQYFKAIRIPWIEFEPDEIIRSIRRLIGDNDPSNYRIRTEELYWFLKDAIDVVQAEIDFGYELTISNTSITWNKTLYSAPFVLFKAKAIILILESVATNFMFGYGNIDIGDIKINMTPMMKVRQEYLKTLIDNYNKLLYEVKLNGITGVSVDTYVTGLIENMAGKSYIVYG